MSDPTAPVCLIEPVISTDQPAAQYFPSIPQATNLQSALAAINTMAQILRVLTNQQGNNMAFVFQGPAGAPGRGGTSGIPGRAGTAGAAGKAGTAAPKGGRFAEVNRTTNEVKLASKEDPEAFIVFNRIDTLTFKDTKQASCGVGHGMAKGYINKGGEATEDFHLIDLRTGEEYDHGWMDDIVDFNFPHKPITVFFKIKLQLDLYTINNAGSACVVGQTPHIYPRPTGPGGPFGFFTGWSPKKYTAIVPAAGRVFPAGVTMVKPPPVSPKTASYGAWAYGDMAFGSIIGNSFSYNDGGEPFPVLSQVPIEAKHFSLPIYFTPLYTAGAPACYGYSDFPTVTVQAGGAAANIIRTPTAHITVNMEGARLTYKKTPKSKPRLLKYKSSTALPNAGPAPPVLGGPPANFGLVIDCSITLK